MWFYTMSFSQIITIIIWIKINKITKQTKQKNKQEKNANKHNTNK